MIIYPAMDLIGGKAVRLRQGRFDEVTAYDQEPLQALQAFARSGATWAHVVDLDGALAGSPKQQKFIARLAQWAPLKLQVAGGYRTADQLEAMFDAGVSRIVIGSLAVRDPALVRAWIGAFGPERIALSFDVRLQDGQPMVAIAGWTEDTGRALWDVAGWFTQARHFLITDIGRDGMLQGPNFSLYDRIGALLPNARIQASGGVTSLADLERLNTDGAIIGKSLWEGLISLEEAIERARA